MYVYIFSHSLFIYLFRDTLLRVSLEFHVGLYDLGGAMYTREAAGHTTFLQAYKTYGEGKYLKTYRYSLYEADAWFMYSVKEKWPRRLALIHIPLYIHY